MSLGWCPTCKELRHFDFHICFRCGGTLEYATVQPSEEQKQLEQEELRIEADAWAKWTKTE